ncbi:hypothetical protein [Amycolatopsis sp. PS_44_ISF1]|uniref:hypothetical protein n=1 Tax=Amycolatopsis sp. PS_44_ISF1 TaxID=2974917 RepID=UPI0037BFA52A
METITATYRHDDEDWTITVSGLGRELSAKAPGIIAARDRADQLVDQVAPDGRPTVVHLLNGSALEFTSTYMTARLTLPEIEPLRVPPSGGRSGPGSGGARADADPAAGPAPTGSGTASDAAPEPASSEVSVPDQASGKPAKPQLPASKQLPKEVEDRRPEEPSHPAVPAVASAQPPATRA